MHRVLVIGSGNAFTSDGRGQAAFLLEHSRGGLMLMDCGATTLLQMNRLGVDPNSIDRILITHFHGDHLGGVPFIILHDRVLARRKHPLDLLGPVGLRTALEGLMQATYPGFDPGFEIRFTELKPGIEQESGGFRIEGVKVEHRPESLGYRVTGPSGRSLAFSGDAQFTGALESLYEGVDVGILELSVEEQPPGGTSHISLEEVREGRDRLRAGRIYFSHIYDRLARLVEAQEAQTPGFGEALQDGSEIYFAQPMHSAGH